MVTRHRATRGHARPRARRCRPTAGRSRCCASPRRHGMLNAQVRAAGAALGVAQAALARAAADRRPLLRRAGRDVRDRPRRDAAARPLVAGSATARRSASTRARRRSARRRCSARSARSPSSSTSSIGRECIVADRVMLIDFDHGVVEVERPIRLQGIYKRDVNVGHNCWIGYGACILRGVTVGDNCIVGTNTVVTQGRARQRRRRRRARRGGCGCATRRSGCAGSERQGGAASRRRRRPYRVSPARSFGASGAVRPGRGAARLQQRGGAAVLLGLGRLRGIARAAHRAPGGARELVLAAVAAVGRDRGRVAARLARGDLLEQPSRRTAAGACAALRPSAASVCGPTMPSTASPCARWKRVTARRVCGPKTPSAATPSARWSAATSTPGRHGARRGVDVAAAVAPPASASDSPATAIALRRPRMRRSRRTAAARRARARLRDASHGSGEDRSVVGTNEPRWSSRLRG